MRLVDLLSMVVAVQGLVPIVANNTSEGTGLLIDRKGSEGLLFLLNVGDSGDTLSGSVKFTAKMQHGDASDGSDLADCAAADVIQPTGQDVIASGVFLTVDAPTEDQVVVPIGYRGSKRYVKVILTFTGTHTNGIPVSITVLKSHLRYEGKNQFTVT